MTRPGGRRDAFGSESTTRGGFRRKTRERARRARGGSGDDFERTTDAREEDEAKQTAP
jgi:hypothetical protein